MTENLPVPYDPEFATWQHFTGWPPGDAFPIRIPDGPPVDMSEVRTTYFGDDMWDRLADPITGRPMYYDKRGQPISMRQWGELRELGLDPDGHYGPDSYLRIGEDTVGVAWVSTVWLGLDHGFHFGPGAHEPVIFETMIFGGEHDQNQMRYCTEEEAIKGHAEAVVDLRAGMPPWWAYGGQEEDEWHMRGDDGAD